MSYRPTPGTLLGLLVATAGSAVPFGFSSGGHSNHITDFEWALTVLAGLATLGMALRYIRRFRWWAVHALALAAATWAAAGVYSGAFDPTQTWRWRLGFLAICIGVSLVALFAYVGEIDAGDS